MVTVTALAVPPAMGLLGSITEKRVQVFGWSKSLLSGQAQLSCWYCCSLQRCLLHWQVSLLLMGALTLLFCDARVLSSWSEQREESRVSPWSSPDFHALDFGKLCRPSHFSSPSSAVAPLCFVKHCTHIEHAGIFLKWRAFIWLRAM